MKYCWRPTGAIPRSPGANSFRNSSCAAPPLSRSIRRKRSATFAKRSKTARRDDPYYNSQPDKADWLGEHSQELRDLYERGATIKDDVLVIPAEGHELNNLTSDRAPFINERATPIKR